MANKRVNEIDSYFKAKVESASPMTLIYMVYDRAILTLGEACEFIQSRNRDKFSEKILHAQDCIRELRSSLNLDTGEIAHNLFRLYDFMINQLVEVTITRENPVPVINQVVKMLTDLENTWKIAEKKLNSQQKQEKAEVMDYRSLSLVG